MCKEEITGYSAYFEWLIDTYLWEKTLWKTSIKVLKQLFAIDFTYRIENDVNRIYDGLDIRKKFTNETGIMLDDIRPCSVLEVLLGLSIRFAENVLGDPDETGLAAKWFWKMVENLGLKGLSGSRDDRSMCIILVEIWMDRDFEPDGNGSPFPLRNNHGIDQREVEIWQQIMNYEAENGGV